MLCHSQKTGCAGTERAPGSILSTCEGHCRVRRSYICHRRRSDHLHNAWCMSISGTNYEYLYLLDFTLFYRHYTYNLIDPISRERTVTDGVHVFAALDLVYSYTIHAKNPNVLKHKIFNYSIRFKGTHSDAETADYLGITRMRVAKLAREMNEEEYAKWHPGSVGSPESEKDGDQSAE